jgi:hypothetical protein
VEPVRKSLPLDLKKTWITADDIDFRTHPAYLLYNQLSQILLRGWLAIRIPT